MTDNSLLGIVEKHDLRVLYWNHFVEQFFVCKVGGGQGITGLRLRKVKRRVMSDDALWWDIIDRHNGQAGPKEMRLNSLENYEHCQGNFWGMVIEIMREYGLIT